MISCVCVQQNGWGVRRSKKALLGIVASLLGRRRQALWCAALHELMRDTGGLLFRSEHDTVRLRLPEGGKELMTSDMHHCGTSLMSFFVVDAATAWHHVTNHFVA
jgi:hypothetical protein